MSTIDLVVAERRGEADTVVSLTLRRPDGGDLPAWTPGAHIDLLLGPGLVRQYSLCGDPGDRTAWRIAVARIPDGRGGSAHVHDNLTAGQPLTASGPRNHFALEPAPAYRFVAGGIGITPILPMIAHADRTGTPWTLWYRGRSHTTMAFAHHLRDHHSADQVTLSARDLPDTPGLDTYLAAAPDDALVYCCGPAPMLDAVAALIPESRLRTERFTAADSATPNTPFDVTLLRSGRTLTVPADRSILEVALEAGVQVLYSCTEGTCGTCETDIHEGEADHRDSILTPTEQRANTSLMICVSRCTGSRLTLDL